MKLIVGATPFSRWQYLNDLLLSLGWEQKSNERPEDWINSEPSSESAYLLLYLPACIAVAYALDKGKKPTSALQQWKAAIRQSLLFYRRHRRQTLLINVIQALNNPEELLRHCQQRFSITAEQKTIRIMPPPTILNQLLAQQLIIQQKELSDDLAELEASTTQLQDDSCRPEFNIDLLHNQLEEQAQRAHEHSVLLSQIDEKEQNNREVMTQMQEEQKALREELQHLQVTKNALKQDYDRAQTELHLLRQDKKNVEEENALILQQLHQVQEELETLHLKHTGREHALYEYKSQTESLSKELQRLQTTKNGLSQDCEHAQAELHLLRQDKTNVEEENALILQQLHQVQEELEKYHLNNQHLSQQLTQHQQMFEKNSQQLQRITTSISWKATTPIRALGKKLRKETPEERSLKEQVKLLRKSRLFNSDWYLETYPDVAESGMPAIKHYLKFGALEGRNPSEHFDTNWYLQQYPDVIEADLNPLYHYLKYGQEENRESKAVQ
ncbi:coiled-coil domain-containing protein [Oceanimonas marisflavi]|uniref:hypothetical protein n=1 Tax=Oceanimonas marisflavi TaxID=2059724 RepID=UPI0013006B64|nr:hypothetical protein [Oceanimonas marisflavi]